MGRLLLVATILAGQPPAPLKPHLEAYLDRVARSEFNGAVLVAEGDEVIVARGLGFLDHTKATPVTVETIFDLGSVTKQFTAAAIVQLEARGLLRVTDSVGGFFPEAPADKAGITIHQLLTHTAGLADDYATDDFEPIDRTEFLHRVWTRPLASTPGSYAYSNGGYGLLAAILETVTGQSWQQYLHGNIFDPAGLAHCGFYNDPIFDSSPVAIGYFNGKETGNPARFPGPYWGVIGNGEILCPLGDLYRWVDGLRRNLVLSRVETDRLFTRHVREGSGDSWYGYGWTLADTPEGRLITHNGGGSGGNADVAIYPDRRLIIIVLSNAISYRTLGPVPLEIRLPATELRQQLARNIFSGDFSRLPPPTFVIYPYVAIVLVVVGSLVGLVGWNRWKSARRAGVASVTASA